MLDLNYISHLHPGAQKSLAYALGLAKVFSAPLSLVPSSNLGDLHEGRISIWRPRPSTDKKSPSNKYFLPPSRKERFSLYLLGKPSQPAQPNSQSYQIIQRLVDLGFPTIWIPFNYPYKSIKNVLFASSGPGLTDHRVKQLIAANFLPRVFQIGNRTLSRIHWNNIGHIVNEDPRTLDFNCPRLAAEISKNEIDLTIYPVHSMPAKTTTIDWRGISTAKHPLLFLPLSAENSTSVKKSSLFDSLVV